MLYILSLVEYVVYSMLVKPVNHLEAPWVRVHFAPLHPPPLPLSHSHTTRSLHFTIFAPHRPPPLLSLLSTLPHQHNKSTHHKHQPSFFALLHPPPLFPLPSDLPQPLTRSLIQKPVPLLSPTPRLLMSLHLPALPTLLPLALPTYLPCKPHLP